MLAGAIGMMAIVFHYRVTIGPKEHRVNPPGNFFILPAMILFGVAPALLLRSPFRQPIGERMFRLVWLGPLGRAFIGISGRKSWQGQPAGVTRTRPTSVPVSRPTSPPVKVAVAPDRIAELEHRVSELERWRKEAR
jgi:hypothetical protein